MTKTVRRQLQEKGMSPEDIAKITTTNKYAQLADSAPVKLTDYMDVSILFKLNFHKNSWIITTYSMDGNLSLIL